MARDISEADWKLLRQLHPVALDRYCGRVLDDVSSLVANNRKGAHERYLALHALIKERDRDLADAFNDLRRSTAFLRLALIRSHDLLTEGEMSGFSGEMRQRLESLRDGRG